jgi:hypothetical protein
LSSSVQLWRGFFPSWKFFDEVGSVPQLYFRVSVELDEMESLSWQTLAFKAPRRLGGLFFNPQAAFQMFSDTLLRQLVQQISQDEAHDMLETTSSFRIVQNYVYRSISRGFQGESFYYQFKIQLNTAESGHQVLEDLVISRIFQGPPK